MSLSVFFADAFNARCVLPASQQSQAGLFTSFCAGFEDGLNFWGGATVYDPDGKLLAKGPYDDEALTCAELDLAQLRRTRARLPLLRDEQMGLVMTELQRVLQKKY